MVRLDDVLNNAFFFALSSQSTPILARDVAADRSKCSTAAGGAEVAGKACVCARRGVQRVDEHNWRRNHVYSGDPEGARSDTSFAADCDYRRVIRNLGGVLDEVHAFRRDHHVRRNHEGVVRASGFGAHPDMCYDY